MRDTTQSCDRCLRPFSVVMRSPHDADRCVGCDPAMLSADDRLLAFIQDIPKREAK